MLQCVAVQLVCYSAVQLEGLSPALVTGQGGLLRAAGERHSNYTITQGGLLRAAGAEADLTEDRKSAVNAATMQKYKELRARGMRANEARLQVGVSVSNCTITHSLGCRWECVVV